MMRQDTATNKLSWSLVELLAGEWAIWLYWLETFTDIYNSCRISR